MMTFISKNKEKTMLQTQACEFTNRYSDIEGFQNGQTVVYSARSRTDGNSSFGEAGGQRRHNVRIMPVSVLIL